LIGIVRPRTMATEFFFNIYEVTSNLVATTNCLLHLEYKVPKKDTLLLMFVQIMHKMSFISEQFKAR
jgi:hypothetical protein